MFRKFAGSERPLRGAPATAGLILVLLGLLVFSLMAAVTFGSTDIPMADVYHVIAHQLFGVGDPAWGDGNLFRAVWYIRLPRLILAMAIGMGLSVCGVVMQAVVKNPMADPYVLGISSGASLGATAAILLGVGSALGSNFVGVMAFLGAFAISLAVVGLANIGGPGELCKVASGRYGPELGLQRVFQLHCLFCPRSGRYADGDLLVDGRAGGRYLGTGCSGGAGDWAWGLLFFNPVSHTEPNAAGRRNLHYPGDRPA